MPSPFDALGFEAAPPFDPQSLMQTGAPAPPTQAPQQRPGFDKTKLLRLIPLVAAAAKGGPGALEGLLSGYQQAEQRRQHETTQQAQTERQSMLDDRQLQQTQFTQGLQAAQFQQQQEVARSGLVQEFSKALLSEDLTDPEAVRALTQLYEARGRALGVRPGTFETTAMQVVKPSALETKAAKKKVNELRTQFGVKWMEEGAKFQHELPGGKRVSFQQLIGLAGMTPDPSAPPAIVGAEPQTDYERSLARYAKSIGKTFADITPADEVAVKKSLGQADDNASSPRQRYVVQQITNQDGTTGLVRVNMETGQAEPVTLPSGAGAGRAGETERISAAYTQRTIASDVTAKKFERVLSGLGSQLDVRLPNLLRSEAGQMYRQAKDEFINAALRRESGAAIQPSEYTRFDQIYFVVPGDTVETITQKQAARQRVIDGFRVAAGNLVPRDTATPGVVEEWVRGADGKLTKKGAK